MRPSLFLIPLGLLVLSCASLPHPSGSLPGEVERVIVRQGKQRLIGVAFHHLGTGVTFSANARERFHAASTMKVPVMMAFFEAIDRGALRLDEPIPVRNEFHSIMDDSVYTLDPKEDGDPGLYQAVGQTRPLEELIRRMIVRSSNLATNLLIERIGAPTVMDLMRRLEIYDLRVLRGVEDQKAFDAGMNNVTTANDLRLVLEAIADGETFSQASGERMIDILKAQELNEKIPAGLPPARPSPTRPGTSPASTTTRRSSSRRGRSPTSWWSSPPASRTGRKRTAPSRTSRGPSGRTAGARRRRAERPPLHEPTRSRSASC